MLPIAIVVKIKLKSQMKCPLKICLYLSQPHPKVSLGFHTFLLSLIFFSPGILITLLTKVHLVKAMVFSAVMYGCESWAIKKAKHQKLMLLNCGLKKTLESPLDCKIKPVNPKENQSWIFIGRTDAEADASALWLPDARSQLIGKDPDAEKG